MYLKLDSSKANRILGWQPRLNLDVALQWIVEWYRVYAERDPSAVREITETQIRRYMESD